MNSSRSTTLALTMAGALALLGGASPARALSIDTVYIGNPGNPNTESGYGSVSLGYNIGKFEITLNQYTEFLNAVADLDSFGLFNPSMATDLNIAGILRTGGSGNYSYSVLGNGQRPVTYVSWFDAARFANWMHNGQLNTGAQTAGTTEQGAYTLNGATAGVGFLKNTGAQWWIPSENEWFKAAYYDPSPSGPAGDYWLYPTQANTTPNSRNGSGTDANSANFYRNDFINNGANGGYAVTNSPSRLSSQNYLTTVGAFTQADSYYGTFDQGGNVGEWNDAVDSVFSTHGVQGGAWPTNEFTLQASPTFSFDPTYEGNETGFRLASVPEPSTAMLMIGPALMWLARRRRGSAR